MLIVRAVNISGLAPVSDYDYEVCVNDRIIGFGKILGHTRADGWPALLRLIAEHAAKLRE